MGFFSFLTSDTRRSIANNHSVRDTFPVHMVTEDGQVFREEDYEGYGVFGGKDFYVLAAELNGHKGKDDEETRDMFFDKMWKRGIEKDGKRIYHSWKGEGFMKYDDPIPELGGICANDLVEHHGWEHYDPFGGGNTEEFVVFGGYKMPKLVEKLPSKGTDWKKWWDSLPYPDSCPQQGFFYDDDCEEEEEEEF